MSLPELLQMRWKTITEMNVQPCMLMRCSDMRIMEANGLFCDLLNLKYHQVTQSTLGDLGIMYPSHDEYKNPARQVLQLGDNQIFNLTALPLEVESELYHFFVLTESTTKNVTSNPKPARVSASEVLARLFYHSLVPAMITLLSNRTILEVNQGFVELVGYLRQDIIGRNLEKLKLFPDTRRLDVAERKLKQGKSALPIEEKIRCKNGELRSVIMSAEPFDYHHQACAISTFIDITEKKRIKEQLSKAIQAAIQDTEIFSHAVIEKLSELEHHPQDVQVYDLTQRERDVLELLAEGFDNDHIAEKLSLAEHTVRNYITHIYEKLGLHSRAEAVVWARERGFVASK